jgi:hypothetical protein
MRFLTDATTADAVRSTRYAHHYRDWQIQHGNPIARLVRRWRRVLPRRDHVVRHDQPVILDAQARAS